MCRSLIGLGVLSSLVLAGLASPALGCLNDRETTSREREFKSQYQQDASPATPESSGDELIVMSYPKTSLVLGGMMACAGLTVGLGRRSHKV